MARPQDMDLGEVSSLEELADKIREVQAEFDAPIWFRGQRDCEWELLPRVFRPPLARGRDKEILHREQTIATTFKARAVLRRRDCPGEKDFFAWLCLMRHYEVPCRLLDWTKSPLVALFFALVGTEESNPPAVWMLNPVRFNEGTYGMLRPFTQDDHYLQDLANDAFTGLSQRHQNLVLPGLPMAACGEENSLRMLMQSAVFTIQRKHDALEDSFGSDSVTGVLHRVKIKKASRDELLETLETFGIDDNRLYPDLEYLGAELLDDALTDLERKTRREKKRWNVAPATTGGHAEAAGEGENTG